MSKRAKAGSRPKAARTKPAAAKKPSPKKASRKKPSPEKASKKKVAPKPRARTAKAPAWKAAPVAGKAKHVGAAPPNELLAALCKGEDGDAASVAWLLMAGADPAAVAKDGAWGFYKEAGVGAIHLVFNRDVAPAVLDAVLSAPGLDLRQRAASGDTPLHFMLARYQGADRMAVLDRLLALGADVNAPGEDAQSPAWRLLQGRWTEADELVTRLSAAGLDLARRDDADETFLDHVFNSYAAESWKVRPDDLPALARLVGALVRLGAASDRPASVKTWLELYARGTLPTE